jgi:hypothetical protein
MASVWLLDGGGPDAHPVDLGFLGAWALHCENPCSGVLDSLDFLGFSRQNLDLSMGYADFSRKNISRAFFRRRSAGKGSPWSWHAEAQGLFMGQA